MHRNSRAPCASPNTTRWRRPNPAQMKSPTVDTAAMSSAPTNALVMFVDLRAFVDHRASFRQILLRRLRQPEARDETDEVNGESHGSGDQRDLCRRVCP